MILLLLKSFLLIKWLYNCRMVAGVFTLGLYCAQGSRGRREVIDAIAEVIHSSRTSSWIVQIIHYFL